MDIGGGRVSGRPLSLHSVPVHVSLGGVSSSSSIIADPDRWGVPPLEIGNPSVTWLDQLVTPLLSHPHAILSVTLSFRCRRSSQRDRTCSGRTGVGQEHGKDERRCDTGAGFRQVAVSRA